jgi:hypothetical protein
LSKAPIGNVHILKDALLLEFTFVYIKSVLDEQRYSTF